MNKGFTFSKKILVCLFCRLNQLDLEQDNTSVLFALRLWKIRVMWKSILGYILGRNHFHVTTAQELLPPLAIVSHILEKFMEFLNINKRIKNFLSTFFVCLFCRLNQLELEQGSLGVLFAVSLWRTKGIWHNQLIC